MINILVVEDNTDLLEMFCETLNVNGFNTYGVKDGIEALDVLYEQSIDLVVADIMMPNLDGYGLVKEIRSSKNNVPILMVTAKSEYDSMQKAFGIGADDYMIKPINVKELVLRVNALLRRAKINAEKKIIIGTTSLDYETMTVISNGEEFVLPLKEFNLLFKLLSYVGKIFTRHQLMDEIWGMDTDTDDRTVNTHINRLRDKFKNSPDFEIVTIRGLGYKAVKK
jgi:DNA-binding response OmpR family regulator